jgi:hypothetical protein
MPLAEGPAFPERSALPALVRSGSPGPESSGPSAPVSSDPPGPESSALPALARDARPPALATSVLLAVTGAVLLALSALFTRWAESSDAQPVWVERLLRPFTPPGRILLLTLPAMLAAWRYLAPPPGRAREAMHGGRVLAAARGGQSTAGARPIPRAILSRAAPWAGPAIAALSLTPVVAGITSWAAYLALGTAGVVALAAALEPWGGERAHRLAAGAIRLLARPRWPLFLAAAATAHLVLTLALSAAFFGGVPHVQDSVAQLFQAKILAGGALAAPAPPVPEAFDYSHLVISSGRWYSIYHPAHPFVLSLALRLGRPGLANPLLGVAGLLGLALLARAVAGEAVARAVVLLALLSPWWLLMHAEHMNHATAGAALTWALAGFVRTGRGGSPGWAIGSGLLFGVAFLVRPYTPLLVGGALLLFALVRAVRTVRPEREVPAAREAREVRAGREVWAGRAGRGERRWLLACLLIGAGAVPGVLLQLRSNAATTGDPFLEPAVVKQGPGVVPGFHLPPWGPPHTPRLGLRNVLADSDALNRWVLGLPVPFAVLLAGLAGAGIARGRRHRPGWLYAVPAALLAGHFAFWYVDFCFGPRYLFEALPCLLILAGMGLRGLWRRCPARLALAGAAALLGAPFVWAGLAANYAHAYYGVDDRLAARVAAAAPDDGLVFATTDYGGFVWRNDPWLRTGPVFVHARGGAEEERVRRAFPGRRPFRQAGGVLIPLP